MFDAFLSHLYWLNGQNSSRSPSTEESRLSHWCLCSSCGCTATHRCEQPNGGAAGLQCVQKWRTLVVKTRGCHGKWPIYRWFTYIYLFKCWFLLIFLLAMFDYQTVHTPKMVFKDKEQLTRKMMIDQWTWAAKWICPNVWEHQTFQWIRVDSDIFRFSPYLYNWFVLVSPISDTLSERSSVQERLTVVEQFVCADDDRNSVCKDGGLSGVQSGAP